MVSADRLYTFAEALPGLPGSHRYALIAEAAYAPLQWLQSLDEWEICLPVLGLDAVALDGYGAAVAGAAGLEGLADQEGHRPLARILLVTHLGTPTFTVNLLAPIVLDPPSGTGRQLILDAGVGGTASGVGSAPTAADPASQPLLPTPYSLRQPIAWDPSTRTFTVAC